jgi:hypothetical protein
MFAQHLILGSTCKYVLPAGSPQLPVSVPSSIQTHGSCATPITLTEAQPPNNDRMDSVRRTTARYSKLYSQATDVSSVNSILTLLWTRVHGAQMHSKHLGPQICQGGIYFPLPTHDVHYAILLGQVSS